jgi:prephenate dehydrogenase
MGGSLGLAARAKAGVETVLGYSRTRETLDLALARGAITVACDSVEEAAAGADLVFVATPVRLIAEHVRRAFAAAPAGAVVSDVGSTKGTFMRGLTAREQRRCVGGHPLCGAETAGVGNARAKLFEGATYFLTPGAHVDGAAYQRLHSFVTQIGARPVAVDPDEHDRVMALVSHLPHVLANVLMAQVGADTGPRDALLTTGPSFHDMTRIAGSNRRVWTDIFLENREAVLDALSTYQQGLGVVIEALRAADPQALGEQISRAAASRERMLASGSLAPGELWRVVAKIEDRPGVLREIMLTLGDANINIEDVALHHMSAELGGSLTVYVSGEDVCRRAAQLLADLGYEVVTGKVVE